VNREHLLEALWSYAAKDPGEAESLARIRRFVASPGGDPFRRDNPEGHITGSAIVARPDGSAFLLVFHRKLSLWLQPGGHTEEADASVFETALREAREETGIGRFDTPLDRAILDVDMHAIPAHGKDPAHSHFDIRFLFSTSADIDSAASEDPSRPMAWRSLAEALSDGIDASLSRALDKAHGILASGRGQAPRLR
jgi:8-oxo-dGTP pyrophosphatase MutT (NUDIX family)